MLKEKQAGTVTIYVILLVLWHLSPRQVSPRHLSPWTSVPPGQVSPRTTIPLDICIPGQVSPQDKCPPGHLSPLTIIHKKFLPVWFSLDPNDVLFGMVQNFWGLCSFLVYGLYKLLNWMNCLKIPLRLKLWRLVEVSNKSSYYFLVVRVEKQE